MLAFISEAYRNITIFHPSFWFSSRVSVRLDQLYIYIAFVLVLLGFSIFFLILSKLRDNPFLRKFYSKLSWIIFTFGFVAALLSFFRLLGAGALSARGVWILFFFALFFVGYLSLLEFYKKIPEKTSHYETDQIKKRYLRPFKKRK
ncbi:MAG: hypothetical protein Q8P13_01010 [bacterium]|nr:hypothetical protein [bacterium]